MTNLTKEELQNISNLLSQISLPINQAPVVINIINKTAIMIDEIDNKKNEEKKV